VPATAKKRRGRGEDGDDDAVDGVDRQVTPERQVLIGNVQSIHDPDEAP
jgi:hypothetical protein